MTEKWDFYIKTFLHLNLSDDLFSSHYPMNNIDRLKKFIIMQKWVVQRAVTSHNYKKNQNFLIYLFSSFHFLKYIYYDSYVVAWGEILKLTRFEALELQNFNKNSNLSSKHGRELKIVILNGIPGLKKVLPVGKRYFRFPNFVLNCNQSSKIYLNAQNREFQGHFRFQNFVLNLNMSLKNVQKLKSVSF